MRVALSHVKCDVNDQTKALKTACKCAQFCMLRMSTCVASFMLLSTMVSPMLKVCLSLYTLLRSHLRSHLFVNCCIRRYSLYITCGRVVFRGSAILPWIFAVDSWIRGQQVWVRRRGRQQHRRGRRERR